MEKVIEDANIEQMIRDIQQVPEPGTTKPGQVLSDGKDTEGVPVTVGAISSAGYVMVYDSRTGEPSLCNKNMLPAQLKKKREDGSYVFTLNKPAIKLKRGQLKCILHPDNPKRAHYDEMGLPVCKKANLINQFQVTRHMEHKHKDEYKAIQLEIKEVEEKRQREFQERILNMATERPQSVPEPMPDEPTMFECDKCGKPHMFNSKLGQEHIQFKK